MKTETKTIYKCSYCKTLYQKRYFAIKHEDKCRKNPKNDRPCFHCQYLTKKDTYIYYENDHICETVDHSFLFCNKIDLFLYPPQIKHPAELDDRNDPMPKECQFLQKREEL